MLPNLRRYPDGELTLIVQHDSPGTDKDSSWAAGAEGSLHGNPSQVRAEIRRARRNVEAAVEVSKVKRAGLGALGPGEVPCVLRSSLVGSVARALR